MAMGAASLLFCANAALQENGGITENLDRSAIQVKGESDKILFEGMGTEDGISLSNVSVETIQGENRTQLPVENWKWEDQTVGVDWLVFIDVSDSMRKAPNNRVYLKEALKVVNHMVDTLADRDTLRVLASAADVQDLGVAKPGHETELHSALENMDKNAAKRNIQGNATTAFLQQANSYLLSNSAETGRVLSVVIFSDGDDDGSAEGALNELKATAQEKKIHVNSVAFWQGAKNKGTNILANLSQNTHGSYTDFDSAQKDYVPFCRKIARIEHKGQGSFRISRPQGEFERLEVKGFNRQGGNVPTAKLVMTRAQLETVAPAPPAPQTQPAAPAEPDKEEICLQEVMKLMPAALKATQDVAQAENVQAKEERMKTLVNKAKKAVANLLPKVKELKKMDVAKVEKAINKAKEKPGVTQEEKNFLDALLNLCKNSTITEVTEKDVRALLGRDEDWPECSGTTPPPPPAPFWKKAWLWVSVGILALLAGLFVMFRRKKKAAEALAEKEAKEAQEAAENAADEKTVVVRHPRPTLARLQEVDGEHGWEITQPLVTIGRNKDNDICIKDSSVSSHHCAVKYQRGGTWIISDLGSANGIFIRNRIEQEAELHDGDIFQLGRVSLRFTLPS